MDITVLILLIISCSCAVLTLIVFIGAITLIIIFLYRDSINSWGKEEVCIDVSEFDKKDMAEKIIKFFKENNFEFETKENRIIGKLNEYDYVGHKPLFDFFFEEQDKKRTLVGNFYFDRGNNVYERFYYYKGPLVNTTVSMKAMKLRKKIYETIGISTKTMKENLTFIQGEKYSS